MLGIDERESIIPSRVSGSSVRMADRLLRTSWLKFDKLDPSATRWCYDVGHGRGVFQDMELVGIPVPPIHCLVHVPASDSRAVFSLRRMPKGRPRGLELEAKQRHSRKGRVVGQKQVEALLCRLA